TVKTMPTHRQHLRDRCIAILLLALAGRFSNESASRFTLLCNVPRRKRGVFSSRKSRMSRSAYLRIASMHILMHTPYRLRQTCNDLRRLQMPANPFKSLKIGVCLLVWPITCAGLTVACDEHGRPGKTPSQRTRAKRIRVGCPLEMRLFCATKIRDGTEKGPVAI